MPGQLVSKGKGRCWLSSEIGGERERRRERERKRERERERENLGVPPMP